MSFSRRRAANASDLRRSGGSADAIPADRGIRAAMAGGVLSDRSGRFNTSVRCVRPYFRAFASTGCSATATRRGSLFCSIEPDRLSASIMRKE